MIKQDVCEALRKLRASRPELASYKRFKEVSGINRQTVEDTERGQNFPGVETIEKWVTACGYSVSAFFEQLEGGKRSDNGVHVVAGYEHLYRLLTAIIESGEVEYIQGIRANLYGMLLATGSELPDGVPPIKEVSAGGAVKARRKKGRGG